MRRPVFAANWKLNIGPSVAREYMAAFLAACEPRPDRSLAFFPPALTLAAMRDLLSPRPDVLLGVQNISVEEKGAFTGENSAPIARDAGAGLVLVGHSERRRLFGETDEETAAKCAIALHHRLIPILCVGETLHEREAGRTEEVVGRQLSVGVGRLGLDEVACVLVAYEPVWAIGTGRNATPADASHIHGVIRQTLTDRIGARGREITILYGGSVTRHNAGPLLAARDVDGLLVGGASLEPDGWAEICNT